MTASALPFVVERSSSGAAGAGEELSSHPTPKAGRKALIKASKGGVDRDLILYDRRTGVVLERSMRLNKTCVCGHDKLIHVPQCSSCRCLRYEERRASDEPPAVVSLDKTIHAPWEDPVQQEPEDRIVRPW